jgi:hypothetical protein
MNSRDYQSGAKKRKKRDIAITKHEEFMAKVPKLATFFSRNTTGLESTCNPDSGKKSYDQALFAG